MWEDERIDGLIKAEDSETFAYLRQDFDDAPDYFVGPAALEDAKGITTTNAFENDYAWGHSELVDFDNERGERLQGALFYPADYQPSESYPMIVYIYEKRSQLVHNYVVPTERRPYNTAVFTQEGYFVLQPDIVYRDRDPGVSAVESVVPAVESVLARGIVDPNRVGLVGHSWGATRRATYRRGRLSSPRRVLQWFGHYLKGDDAPAWMTRGVTALEREEKMKR